VGSALCWGRKYDLGETPLQPLEFDGLLEEILRAQGTTLLSVAGRGLSAYHENRYPRGVTKRVKILAEFEARELRHHQIEQDSGGFVFKDKPYRFRGLVCIDHLVMAREAHLHHQSQCLIVIHNQ
jgi:hypothetical protein